MIRLRGTANNSADAVWETVAKRRGCRTHDNCAGKPRLCDLATYDAGAAERAQLPVEVLAKMFRLALDPATIGV